jgi:uncharacterized delta-60 repeat protein
VADLAPGTLDATFGIGGKVLTGFGVAEDERANRLALQGDGRIVLAGYAYDGATSRFALARYTTDGNLDGSFGVEGKVSTEISAAIGGGFSEALSVAIQGDGKVVAAGRVFDGTRYSFALTRYTANGSPDGSFGSGGEVVTSIGPHSMAYSVAIQADGKIVAAGVALGPTVALGQFAMVRYLPDGSLDASFGTGGKVTTPAFVDDDQARSVVIQGDGKLVVAGGARIVTGNDSRYNFAVARYLPDGRLDQGFGTGGKVSTFIGPLHDHGQDVAVQGDGKIVAVGEADVVGPEPHFALARYTANGGLDPSFGIGGKVTTVFAGSGLTYASALAIQANGKIVVAGGTDDEEGNKFALARYTPSGSLDGTFGKGGKVTSTITARPSGVEARAFDVAIQADGRILAAGASGNRFALARYLTEAGFYQPLAMARVLDTRNGTGAPVGKLPGGATLELGLSSRGGVPAAGVAAVVLNVTVTQPEAGGHLTAFPTAQPRPNTSNLNFSSGQTIANLAVAKVGAGGKVSIHNGSLAATHVIADVAGWFADYSGPPPLGSHRPLTPARVLDTRSGTGAPTGKLAAGATLDLQAVDVGGVPGAGVLVPAVVLNVTTTQPGAGGHLTVFPTGEARPNTANLHFSSGQTIAGLVVAKLGAGFPGQVSIYNGAAAATHVIADVAGWFAGFAGTPAPGSYRPVTPVRLLDTRNGTGAPAGKLAGGATLQLQLSSRGGVPAAGVAVVVLTVSVTQPGAGGRLTVFPTGQPRPIPSNLHFSQAQTIANLVLAKLGTGGKVSIHNGSPAATHVIADVAGWFARA